MWTESSDNQRQKSFSYKSFLNELITLNHAASSPSLKNNHIDQVIKRTEIFGSEIIDHYEDKLPNQSNDEVIKLDLKHNDSDNYET